MATFVAANAVAYSGFGAVDVALPAGLSAGDSLFAAVAVEGGGATVTMPTGWDEVTVGGTPVAVTTNVTIRLYRRQRQSGDADVISVSASAISQAVTIFAFGDLGAVEVWAADSAAFSNSPPSISVTTTGANQWLLYIASIGTQGRMMTAPSGMTQPSAVASGGSSGSSFISIGGAYEGPVAADTYARQASWDGGSPTGALMIGIAEAGGGADVALASDLQAVATVSGSLTTAIPLAAAWAGVATLTAALTTAIPFASAFTSTATLAGDLTTSIPLAASLASTATLGGSLTTAIPLAADLVNTATLAGDLTTAIPLAADMVGAATLTAALTTAIPLASDFTSTATLSGALAEDTASMLVELQMFVAMTASLTTEIPLEAGLSGTATMTGDLTTALPLAASLQSIASLGGALTTAIPLAADLAAAPALGGALTTAIPLAAAFACSVTLTGELSTPAQLEVDPSRVFYARLPPSLFPAAVPPRRFNAAAPPRIFEARLSMTPQHTIKDPGVDCDLTMDFAIALPGGATLTDHEVTASGGSIVSSSVDGLKVIARLSGGEPGETINVRFVATPNSGAPRVSTVAVRIGTIYAQQPTA